MMIEESGNEVGAVLTMYEYCVSMAVVARW
jgi:hypothetical protein